MNLFHVPSIDYMVLSWTLNFVSKEIAESFIYAKSIRALWKEIEDRYSKSNAPPIYQIHREINDTCQGEMSVTRYYTKLKKLWDKLGCLESLPESNCGVVNGMFEIMDSHKVMQFLV